MNVKGTVANSIVVSGFSRTLLLLTLAGAVLAARQAPAPAALTVSGVVTTADDAPLARVRVAPGTAASEPVFTDAKGQFQLRVSDAPSVRLTFSKSGYLASAIDVPTRVSTERETGLRVRLVRAGAISGRVLDQSGSPLRVAVTLRRVGGPSSSAPLSTTTNDLGEYRFGGLSEGTFVVAARPPSDPVGGNPEARTAPVAPVEAPPTNVRPGRESGDVNLTVLLPSPAAQRVLSLTIGSDSGTASISGRVVGHDGVPIAGVSVFTMRGAAGGGWVALTDASGRYRIDRLAAGEHTVRALRNGYLSRAYGQISLRERQELSGIDLTLFRGGAIDGTIVDDFGEPVEGVAVEVRGIVTVEGRPRVSPRNIFQTPGLDVGAVLFGNTVTDDRGRYRVFGLQAGSYVVQVVQRERSASARAVLPVYYPGTPVIDQATTLKLTPDAVATGIDLILRPERGYRIAGTVRHADGRPAGVGVVLAKSDRSGAIETESVGSQTASDGSFAFLDVAPGEYVLQTSVGRGAQSTVRALAAGPAEFAATFVTVGNADPARVEMLLVPTTTVRGRVTYEGPSHPPVQVIPLTVRSVDRDRSPRTAVSLPGFPGDGNGMFELGGLFGSAYLIARSPRPEWYVKSIIVNGQDIVAAPYDFGTGRTITGAEIVVSAGAATATGRVTDDSLAPMRDCVVLILSADPDKRVSGSQWVKTVRPLQDGTFRIPGMPPGDYWVAAVDRLDEGSTTPDPGLLESLSFRGTRITLGEGQARDVALRVIRR